MYPGTETKLRPTNTQSGERLQLMDEFLTAAAHDLRSPLTVILGQAQLLKRRALRDPSLKSHLESINSILAASLRMKRWADYLLDAARRDHVGFIEDLEPADVLLLAQEAADSFGAQGRRIVVGGEPTIALVNRVGFEQVLSNLLGNALKYSPARAPVCITVGREREGAYVAVSDMGDGIDETDLRVIFERFRRGSGLREQRSPGSGLGLYNCKRIVEEHGGTISVWSAPGAGSIFRVTLPLQCNIEQARRLPSA